jgi:hypothetical protein
MKRLRLAVICSMEGPGARGKGVGSVPVASRSEDRGDPPPLPWGLPSRAGPPHGKGLHHHRLRGRAGQDPRLPTAQVLPASGRGWNAAILPLRCVRGPARPGARGAAGRLSHPGAVGAVPVPRGERGVPQRLSPRISAIGFGNNVFRFAVPVGGGMRFRRFFLASSERAPGFRKLPRVTRLRS